MKNRQSQSPDFVIQYVLLHGRYPVIIELFHGVVQQLVNAWGAFDEGKPYTAKQLCGDPFWALLSPRDRQLAGMCISQLIRLGELPLVRVACRPNRYLVHAEARNASLAWMLSQPESSASSSAVSHAVEG